MTDQAYKIGNYSDRQEYIKAGYAGNWGYDYLDLARLEEIVGQYDSDIFSIIPPSDWFKIYEDRLPENLERTGKGKLLAVIQSNWESEVFYLEVRRSARRDRELWVEDEGNRSLCVTYQVWEGVRERVVAFLDANSPDEDGEED